MKEKDHKNVLIVGAGPCGLTAAAFLTHYGISCRVIDQKKGPVLTSNAIGVQARTLELLEEIDLEQSFLEAGVACKTAEIYLDKKLLINIDMFGHIRSKYPFMCMVPQDKTESILLGFLKKQGVHVEYATRALQIDEKENQVLTQVEFNGKKETIYSEWLIGSDGYHSMVRDVAQVEYEGEDYTYKFILIDAPVEIPSDLEKKTLVGSGDDFTLMMFPTQNSYRLLAEVSESERYQFDPDPEIFRTMVEAVLPGDISIGETIWSSKFYIHERLAKHYRKGRIFLAGDAVHTHLPAGGQGMNTGIQDSINLSWKLAQVIQGRSSNNILNSYMEERRPVAQKVLKLTKKTGKQILNQNPILKFMMKQVIAPLSRVGLLQDILTNTMAQVSIHYRGSSLSKGRSMNGLKPGDRCVDLPLKQLGSNYCLIDGVGNIPEVWKEQFSIELVQHSTLNSKPFKGYCLVRPDRYIAYLGTDLQALERHL